MQIFVKGTAEQDFAPDQISATVSFSAHADNYNEALRLGVEKVKAYLDFLQENTDFSKEDFKTSSYHIHEEFHTNKIEPKDINDLNKNLTKRISDGFYFYQTGSLLFDYDRERLAKLLVLTSQNPSAPRFHIDFRSKDTASSPNSLIPAAYENAKSKAEQLANAASKHLRDCVRVELEPSSNYDGYERDGAVRYSKAAYFGASETEIEQQMQNIDETFHPDDITLSKTIECVWETTD